MLNKKQKTDFNKALKKYHKGEISAKSVIDMYFEFTKDINKRESVGVEIYPNLLTFFQRMANL